MIETNVIKEFKKALKAFVKEIQKKRKFLQWCSLVWYNFWSKEIPPYSLILFLKSAAFRFSDARKKKLGFISCFECALAKNDFGRTKYIGLTLMDGVRYC